MHPPANPPTCVGGGYILELQTNLREDFTNTEQAFNQEKVLLGGLLHDCEIFPRVSLKLYFQI